MCVDFHLILGGASWIVLCIIPIFIILFKLPSLNKFILGSQVKVPQFTGCPVFRSFRLDKHKQFIFMQENSLTNA